jgi:hypothetical protein
MQSIPQERAENSACRVAGGSEAGFAGELITFHNVYAFFI